MLCVNLASVALHYFLHQDAVYIQECVPEILDLKRKVWNNIDSVVTNPNTIMASSSSCIVPSKISNDLKHKEQFIIAHPVSRKLIKQIPQCGNVRIFLSLRFYVKSILENVEVLKLLFLPI